MKNNEPTSRNRLIGSLRERAVALLKERGVISSDPEVRDLKHLLNELHTHQIELELQNDELQRTQHALEESRDQFASLYEYAPTPYLSLDEHRIIRGANRVTENQFGMLRRQLIGLPFTQLIEPASQDVFYLNMRQLGRQEGAGNFDLQVVTAGGECRSVNLHVHRNAGELQHDYLVAIIDITDRKRAEVALNTLNQELEQRITAATAELTQTQFELRCLIREMVDRQEYESQKIARELHDSIGQDIAALALKLGQLRKELGPEPQATSTLDELMRELRRISSNLRNISRHIHPKIIEDLGLQAAIRRESELMTMETAFTVQFDASPFAEEPAADTSLACYRIFQECIRNVIRHTGAAEVNVQLGVRKGHLYMIVADNGPGFDRVAVRQKGGLGLISMDERARLVGGRVHIESSPGKGALVEFSAPMEGGLPVNSGPASASAG